MTTIDTGFSALPGADPVPQLAGLPSAAELSALANSLFPDLTKDFETAGLKFEPTVCAEGIDKLVKTGDPSIVNTAAAKAETAYNHLAHSQNESEPLPQAGVPVRWIIDAPAGSINGCNYKMLLQAYDITYTFQEGENILEVTPTEPGTISYSCWMGMIRGTITVTGGS